MDSACVHILITVIPAAGHLNPAIQLALHLVQPTSWKPPTRVTIFSYFSPDMESTVKWPDHPHIKHITKESVELFLWMRNVVDKVDEYATDAMIEIEKASSFTDMDGTPWPPFHAVIFDFMSGYGSVIAEKLGLPNFAFMASPLFSLYGLMSLPELNAARLQDPPATSFTIPGIGDFPIGQKPSAAQEAQAQTFVRLTQYMRTRYVKARGCLANDVQSFYTSEFFKAFEEEKKFPQNWKILCCGPLAIHDVRLKDKSPDDVILFMDGKAPGSVVYVALGTCWTLKAQDLLELVHGLSLSGKPFIFAYRGNTLDNEMRHMADPADFIVDEPIEADGLPVGFREKIKGQGLIVPWVNQLRILQHEALGCFMTHCGWNSCIEALTFAGKPMLLLPIGGDQFNSAHFLANFLKCGKMMWGITPTRKLQREEVSKSICDILEDESCLSQCRRLKSLTQQEISENGICELNTQKFFDEVH